MNTTTVTVSLKTKNIQWAQQSYTESYGHTLHKEVHYNIKLVGLIKIPAPSISFNIKLIRMSWIYGH